MDTAFPVTIARATKETRLTPSQFAKRHGVGVHKVLAWIASGELVAVDVSQRRGGRPRWSILQEHVEDFERRRQVSPVVTPRRKKRENLNVVKYFDKS